MHAPNTTLSVRETTVKYTIPDNMWYKAGDAYIILIEGHDGTRFVIER